MLWCKQEWKVEKLNYACALRHYAFYLFTLYPEQCKYNTRVNGLHYNYISTRSGNTNYLPPPMPTSVTGLPGTGHRLPVPVSRRINEQEVKQAGCCLKVTPGPYATKLLTLTQYGCCIVNCNVCMFLLWLPYGVINYSRPVLSCLRQSYSTHCVCEQQGSRTQEVFENYSL